MRADTELACGKGLHERWHLGRRPNIEPAIFPLRGCVHRLHAGMGKERRAVLSLDHILRPRRLEKLCHIAIVAEGEALAIARALRQ